MQRTAGRTLGITGPLGSFSIISTVAQIAIAEESKSSPARLEADAREGEHMTPNSPGSLEIPDPQLERAPSLDWAGSLGWAIPACRHAHERLRGSDDVRP